MRQDEAERPARGRTSASAFLQTLAAYALAATGILAYALNALGSAPEPPRLSENLPLALIASLPLALLITFIVRFRGLIIDVRKRRYGSRLRLRLAGLFLLVMVLASLPQGLVLLRVAQEAQGSGAATDLRKGLSAGLGLVLAYRAEEDRRLEYLVRHDLPLLAPGRLPGKPERVLEAIQAREARAEALEVFVEGRSFSFAGNPRARLARPPATGVAGPLPSTTVGGLVLIPWFLPWGGPGGGLVLTLRLPEGFDRQVAALSKAAILSERMVPFSATWTKVLALLYAILVLPLLLIAALLGVAAADYVAEPLLALEKASQRVASGDFGVRLLVKPGDETGRLVASFNRMLQEIEKYREGDLRKGRIDAWKDIAQRLAHELKNPLTPIRLSAERLLRASTQDPQKALPLIAPSMVAVIAEVEAMDALLQEFRSFASLPEPMRDWADLRTIVGDAVFLYAASYPEVAFDYAGIQPGTALKVDAGQLKRALANLLANAVEAMGGKGRIEIGADLVKAADSRYCRIRVSDSGPGIAAENLDQVFLPYFTTKETGTGLGLPIVERIVLDHGGSIRCESEPGAGASFLIDIPLDH